MGRVRKQQPRVTVKVEYEDRVVVIKGHALDCTIDRERDIFDDPDPRVPSSTGPCRTRVEVDFGYAAKAWTKPKKELP